jgi:hypothetical protein
MMTIHNKMVLLSLPELTQLINPAIVINKGMNPSSTRPALKNNGANTMTMAVASTLAATIVTKSTAGDRKFTGTKPLARWSFRAAKLRSRHLKSRA